MSLKENLRELRKKAGMTQEKLATKSDVSRATISRVEKGHVEHLQSGRLERLADALGVEVADLLKRRLILTDVFSLSDTAQPEPYDDASDMLRSYGRLSPEGKQVVRMLVRFVEQQEHMGQRSDQEEANDHGG